MPGTTREMAVPVITAVVSDRMYSFSKLRENKSIMCKLSDRMEIKPHENLEGILKSRCSVNLMCH